MVDGRSFEGAVTVWRNPVVHPTDLETWSARPWPVENKWPIDNALICSTQGLGVTALAGGDYDGDEVFITADRGLLEFMLATEGPAQATRYWR